MVIIIFALIFSTLILAFGITKRKKESDTSSRNTDLLIFYNSYGEPINQRVKYLIKAAKTLIDDGSKLSDKMGEITYLHDEKIVSDEYYNSIKNLEEELEIEKIMIENEAECLKSGFKEIIFSEAAKLPNSDLSRNKKLKLFDEALYLKRKEALMKDLVNRIQEGASC